MLDVFDDDLEIDQDFQCQTVTQNDGPSTSSRDSNKPSSAKRSRLSAQQSPKSKLKRFTFLKSNFDDKLLGKDEIQKEPCRVPSVPNIVEVSDVENRKEDTHAALRDVDFDSFFADDFDCVDDDQQAVTAHSDHLRCNYAASSSNISRTCTNTANIRTQAAESSVNDAKELSESLLPKSVPDSVSIFARKAVTSEMNLTPHPKRKFPGPAGLLSVLKGPRNRQVDAEKALGDAVNWKNGCRQANDPAAALNLEISCSQSFKDDFNSGPWLAMMKDLSEESSGQPGQILNKFSIASVLEKASGKKFSRGRKVPLLFVMLQSKFYVHSGFIAVFKDQTGKITASMCRTLIDEHEEQLKPGCTLVLKQVALFSPSSKKHYLTVTACNVAHLYSKNNEERVEHLSLCADTWKMLLNQASESPPALTLGTGRAIARSEVNVSHRREDVSPYFASSSGPRLGPLSANGVVASSSDYVASSSRHSNNLTHFGKQNTFIRGIPQNAVRMSMQRHDANRIEKPISNAESHSNVSEESVHKSGTTHRLDVSEDPLWADDDFESVLRDLDVEL